ncbi:MAG: hypothetical protein AAGJ19_16725 [Myxococcota bacterium]
MSAPPLVLHLHAHLPECRPARPGGVDFEDWFFEALQGSYLPLLQVFEGWVEDGIEARGSLSLSAPLLSMLQDEDLMDRARHRWSRCAELARSLSLPFEVKARLAQGFERSIAHSRDPLGRLRRLEGRVLDVVGTGASHGLLPFVRQLDPRWSEAQVGIGLSRLRRAGFSPLGFWLPECGVDPETAALMARHRVPFSFVEGGSGPAGIPFQAPEGTVFFPRSLSVAEEIWDPEHGIPGQGAYREFHRDAARELEPELLARFELPADGRPLNLKVWSINGQFHSVDKAEGTLDQDVERFWRRRSEEGVPAVGSFDAELFGHWWSEGPHFLDRLARHPEAGALCSAAEVVREQPELPLRPPTPGTWGQHGFGRTWLGPDNAWIHDRIMGASQHFFALREAEEARRRLPHLLGLMASDWPFLIRGQSYLDAIPLRIQDHLDAVHSPSTPLHAGLDVERDELQWLGWGPS